MSRLLPLDEQVESVLAILASALKARLAATNDRHEYLTLKCVDSSTTVDDTAVYKFHARPCPERSFAEFERFSWSLGSKASSNVALDQIKCWRRAVHVLLDRRFWEILNTNFESIFLIAVECDAVLCIETTIAAPSCKPKLLIYFKKSAKVDAVVDSTAQFDLVCKIEPPAQVEEESAILSKLKGKLKSLFRLEM